MHSTTSIPLLLIVASLASTSLGLHHLVVTARHSLEIIVPRQTTSGPCAVTCAPIQSTLASCSTASCLCTAAIASSLQECINCAVSTDPSVSVVSSAQSLIDSFDSICSTVSGLPSVTIATGTSTPLVPSTTPLVLSTTAPGLSNSPTFVLPTTISQVTIGPSSTPSATSSAGSSSPLKSNALPSKIIVIYWIGAFLVLIAANPLRI